MHLLTILNQFRKYVIEMLCYSQTLSSYCDEEKKSISAIALINGMYCEIELIAFSVYFYLKTMLHENWKFLELASTMDWCYAMTNYERFKI